MGPPGPPLRQVALLPEAAGRSPEAEVNMLVVAGPATRHGEVERVSAPGVVLREPLGAALTPGARVVQLPDAQEVHQGARQEHSLEFSQNGHVTVRDPNVTADGGPTELP